MKTFIDVIRSHKAFAAIVFSLLVLLLIRIPLGTFNESSVLDTISHFMLPAFGVPLLYTLLQQKSYLPVLPKRAVIVLITLTGVTAEVLWEIVEFNVDYLFGLRWQLDNTDTMYDLMLAVIGSAIGGYLYLKTYGVTPTRNGLDTAES